MFLEQRLGSADGSVLLCPGQTKGLNLRNSHPRVFYVLPPHTMTASLLTRVVTNIKKYDAQAATEEDVSASST